MPCHAIHTDHLILMQWPCRDTVFLVLRLNCFLSHNRHHYWAWVLQKSQGKITCRVVIETNTEWGQAYLINVTPVYNLDIMKNIMQHPSSQWTILQWPSWEHLLHDEDHANWQEDLFTHQYSQIFVKFKWKTSLVPRPNPQTRKGSGNTREFSWSCAPSRVPIQNLCK